MAATDRAITIDARGMRCPLPVLRLAKAAHGALAGTVFTLLADDPAAAHDVPAFVRERGWGAVSAAPGPGSAICYTVTR
jgi:tRNA 2-thiouridine synthesizing protein A